MKRLVLGLMGMLLPLFALAGEPLSLQEAVELALQRSPSLEAQKEAIREAEYRREAALSRFFPKVDLTYRYLRLDEAPEAGVPPLKGVAINPLDQSQRWPVLTYPLRLKVGSRDNWGLEATITQPLFMGGALRNGYLLAKLGVDMARLEYEQTRLELIYRVKEAYYGVLKAQEMVRVAEGALEALKEHYRIAQAFYQQGMIPKNDLLQVEVELAQREQDLVAAQNGLEVARAYLKTLLRIPLEEQVELGERLRKAPFERTLEECLEQALKDRPDLRLARLGVEAARKQWKVARAGLLPHISLVFNYERQGDDPSVSGSPYNPEEDSWNFMVVAQWRVWDFGETYFGVKEKGAAVLKAENTLKELMDMARLEVKEAYLALKEAQKRIEVSEKVLEQAKENFRVNEERYKAQVAKSSDVLDALAMQTRAEANYWNSLSDYNLALARLQRAMGVGR